MNYEDRITKEYVEGLLNDRVKIVAGTYTGDGAAERIIDCGGQPKAVYVFTQTGSITGSYMHGSTNKTCYSGGLALRGHPVTHAFSAFTLYSLTVTETGFAVYWQLPPSVNIVLATNRADVVFYYVAFL